MKPGFDQLSVTLLQSFDAIPMKPGFCFTFESMKLNFNNFVSVVVKGSFSTCWLPTKNYSDCLNI
jgi:hypothetical protein